MIIIGANRKNFNVESWDFYSCIKEIKSPPTLVLLT